MMTKNSTSHCKKKIKKGTNDKLKNFKKLVNLLPCQIQKVARTIIEQTKFFQLNANL